MAYISSKCIECKDRTKRCAGMYSGKDENGKRFSGRMYLCDNMGCRINIDRMKSIKRLHYANAVSGGR